MAVIEMQGTYVSKAEIAMQSKEGMDVYSVLVVKHFKKQMHQN